MSKTDTDIKAAHRAVESPEHRELKNCQDHTWRQAGIIQHTADGSRCAVIYHCHHCDAWTRKSLYDGAEQGAVIDAATFNVRRPGMKSQLYKPRLVAGAAVALAVLVTVILSVPGLS